MSGFPRCLRAVSRRPKLSAGDDGHGQLDAGRQLESAGPRRRLGARARRVGAGRRSSACARPAGRHGAARGFQRLVSSRRHRRGLRERAGARERRLGRARLCASRPLAFRGLLFRRNDAHAVRHGRRRPRLCRPQALAQGGRDAGISLRRPAPVFVCDRRSRAARGRRPVPRRRFSAEAFRRWSRSSTATSTSATTGA